jgi:hypothetical protein
LPIALLGMTSIGCGSPSGMRTRANNPGNRSFSSFLKIARMAIVPVEVLISLSVKSRTPS